MFYIPAGRVHAIVAGVLLPEIQQTSNITYRIFDYNRIDPQTGEQRELHTELALDAINFDLVDQYKTNYSLHVNESNPLVHSPFFKTNVIKVAGSMHRDYSPIDSFVIYICLNGSAIIATNNGAFNLLKGETILFQQRLKKLTYSQMRLKLMKFI